MYPHSARALQADAVFVSAMQRSDELNASQTRRAVTVALSAYGGAGCAQRIAQEFGDHPETEAVRMRWARAAVAILEGSPGPEDTADGHSRHLRFGREPGGGILGDQVGMIRSCVRQRVGAVDDELIRVAGLATRVACQRMTPRYLKALSDSIEQVCCLPATFSWDRKATAYAEIVNLLADAAADPVLALLVRNVPGRLYDLMVTVGPAADDIIAGSRRRLRALIRARDAYGAGQEMEQNVRGLYWIAERPRDDQVRLAR
jgi:FCD domain